MILAFNLPDGVTRPSLLIELNMAYLVDMRVDPVHVFPPNVKNFLELKNMELGVRNYLIVGFINLNRNLKIGFKVNIITLNIICDNLIKWIEREKHTKFMNSMILMKCSCNI